MTITTLLDDRDLRHRVEAALFDDGVVVAHATSAEQLSQLVEVGHADGMLLSYTSERIGLIKSVIRTTRERRPVIAILVLTSVWSAVHRRELIAIGADHVIAEWNAYQLIRCLRHCVQMRRAESQVTSSPSSIVTVCGLELNLVTRQATRDGKALELREIEFALLTLMVRHCNCPVSLAMLRDQREVFNALQRQSIALVMKSLCRKLDGTFAETLIRDHGDETYVFVCKSLGII